MSLDDELRAQLRHTLDSTPWTTIDGKKLERYNGKVRDCYIDRERGERIIVVTDRLSAFDAVVGTIPSKGQVLNQLATFWFEQTAHIAPNHMVRVPDPNVMIARECTPLAMSCNGCTFSSSPGCAMPATSHPRLGIATARSNVFSRSLASSIASSATICSQARSSIGFFVNPAGLDGLITRTMLGFFQNRKPRCPITCHWR